MNQQKTIRITLAAMVVAICLLALPGCRGGSGAKVTKALKEVVSGKSAAKSIGNAAKGIGRYGDDAARHISKATVTCETCGGMKQVNFVDDYGNYLYTADCPDCGGKGTTTKYEFK